jgi:hypothetical protein
MPVGDHFFFFERSGKPALINNNNKERKHPLRAQAAPHNAD